MKDRVKVLFTLFSWVFVLCLTLITLNYGECQAAQQGSRSKLPTHDADLGGYITPSTPKASYKLGVALPHFRDPFWVAIAYGVVDEAERWGCKVVAIFEAGGYANLDRQIKQMEDLAQLDVDAILFAPNDYEGTAAIADRVAGQGITVINLANMSKSAKVAYGVNNYDPSVGEHMADWLAKKTGGKANVVILGGPPGANWSQDRVNGFMNKIKKAYPEIKVLATKLTDVDRAAAQKVVEDWLSAFPKIDAVISVAAPLGEGAAAAVEAAGRKSDTLVLTSTLNEETLSFLKQGKIDYVQSERPALTGRLGVQLAIKALNGEAVDLPSYEALVPLPPKILYIFDAPAFTPAEAASIDTRNDIAPKNFDPSKY
jgi:ABC-type sugar transport system substrate-binding protein